MPSAWLMKSLKKQNVVSVTSLPLTVISNTRCLSRLGSLGSDLPGSGSIFTFLFLGDFTAKLLGAKRTHDMLHISVVRWDVPSSY